MVVAKGAAGSKAAVSCQSLMLDRISRSDTVSGYGYPAQRTRISAMRKLRSRADQRRAVFYLMSRGLSEEEGQGYDRQRVRGQRGQEAPPGYAVEMNNLIRMEMKGSIG